MLAGLLGAIGLIISLVAFLFWQSKRAAKAVDAQISAIRLANDLEKQVLSLTEGITERDKTLGTLLAQVERLTQALKEAVAQRDSLVKHLKDPNAAASIIRDAITRSK